MRGNREATARLNELGYLPMPTLQATHRGT